MPDIHLQSSKLEIQWLKIALEVIAELGGDGYGVRVLTWMTCECPGLLSFNRWVLQVFVALELIISV
jgi:hypothetical protein